jgi:hypothetical protein
VKPIDLNAHQHFLANNLFQPNSTKLRALSWRHIEHCGPQLLSSPNIQAPHACGMIFSLCGIGQEAAQPHLF